jgi:toxin CptA
MTHSHRLSSASVSCRLEWRPSRWLIGALLALGLLAASAVLASGVPRPAAWPLAVSALAYACWRAWRESRLPSHALFLPGNELPATLDGLPIEQARVQWRGPLAFLLWRDRQGRPQRLSWWPDTLPRPRRRELRLAAGSLDASRHHRQVAP